METPEIPTQQLFLLATPLQGHSFITKNYITPLQGIAPNSSEVE